MKLLALTFILVSCSSTVPNIKPLDLPACVRLSQVKGYCSTIISGKGFYVDDDRLMDGKTWFEQSIDMVYVPVETWAEIKKYLVLNCKKNKGCKKDISNWDRSIQQGK